MVKKIQYTDSASRELVITNNPGFYLVEEQNITEGDFLILSDEITKLQQLEQNQSLMQTALDDIILGGAL